MKTIIAGSRSIIDYDIMVTAIDNSKIDITELVCGMAQGIDMLGHSYAMNNGISVVEFKPNWSDIDVDDAVIKYNKYGAYNALAGHQRNERMAEYADALIAIWDGSSTGTKDMITRAKQRGLLVHVHRIDELWGW